MKIIIEKNCRPNGDHTPLADAQKALRVMRKSYDKLIRTRHFKNRISDRNILQNKLRALIHSNDILCVVSDYKAKGKDVSFCLKISGVINDEKLTLLANIETPAEPKSITLITAYYSETGTQSTKEEIQQSVSCIERGSLVYTNLPLCFKKGAQQMSTEADHKIYEVILSQAIDGENKVVLSNIDGWATEFIPAKELIVIECIDDIDRLDIDEQLDLTALKAIKNEAIAAVALAVLSLFFGFFAIMPDIKSLFIILTICACFVLADRRINRLKQSQKQISIIEQRIEQIKDAIKGDYQNWVD